MTLRLTWLVVACDYPLLTHDALRQLYEAYEEPITSFVNAEGWCEPLLEIWGPTALSKLADNVREGSKSPTKVVKELQRRLKKPQVESWIQGASTKEERADILHLIGHANVSQEHGR